MSFTGSRCPTFFNTFVPDSMRRIFIWQVIPCSTTHEPFTYIKHDLCKVKVRLTLCFFFLPSTTLWRRIGEMEVYLHAFLTSRVGWGKWSASRPSRVTPRERAPGTQWIRSWVDPTARSGHGGKEKNSKLLQGLELPIIQPVVQHYPDTKCASLGWWSQRWDWRVT
jgi:hypothetical protein